MVERRGSLVDTVIDLLIDGITSGEFPEGSALPAEGPLADRCGASRLTVREAIRVLASQGVVRPVQGRGTYVEPMTGWTSVKALVRSHPGGAAFAVDQLVEVRSLIEIGSAELYAARRSPDDVAALAEDLERMCSAHAAGHIEDFVAADVRFHDRVVEGCGNPFLRAAFQPIARSLHEAQMRTSDVLVIREHALAEHARILAAIRAGSPSDAGAAMRSHLQQTRDDARRHLADSGDS